MTCGADGVPPVEMHDGAGGPITSGAAHHEAWVDAFRAIVRDRADDVAILTGAGGDRMPAADFGGFGGVSDPEAWSKAHDGACRRWRTWSTSVTPWHLAPERVAWMLNAEHDDRDRATRRDEVMPNAAPRWEKPRPGQRRYCHGRSQIIPQAERAS